MTGGAAGASVLSAVAAGVGGGARMTGGAAGASVLSAVAAGAAPVRRCGGWPGMGGGVCR